MGHKYWSTLLLAALAATPAAAQSLATATPPAATPRPEDAAPADSLSDSEASLMRETFTYAGAHTVAQFHERARVGLQSAAGYEEGKALPVSW